MLKIVLLSLLLGGNAFAWDPWFEKGNGGFGIQCKNQPLMSFDLSEAQQRYGLTVEDNAVESVSSRVNYLLTKLAVLNPQRARQYSQWFKTFLAETEFVESARDIPNDFGFAYLPRDCQFVSVVIQRPRSRQDLKRYTILKPNWNQLDAQNKAAMIVHELIYREALQPGRTHYNSEAVRQFNGLLNSTKFTTLTMKEYFEFMQQGQFADAEYAGYTVLLGGNQSALNIRWKNYSFEFYDAHHLKSGMIQTSKGPRHILFNKDGSVAAIRRIL